VPENGVLTVPKGWALNIGLNPITNNGVIFANWNGGSTITGGAPRGGAQYGAINGTVPFGSIINVGEYSVGAGFTLNETVYTIHTNGNYTVIGDNGGTGYTVEVQAANVTVLLRDVRITTDGTVSPFDLITDGQTVTIRLEGDNRIRSAGDYAKPALHVSGNKTLTITSAAGDDSLSGFLYAKVDATGANWQNGAAIGSNSGYEDAGVIVINGGTILAEARGGAGIGGGEDGRGNDTTITGGKVTARSVRGAGIGGGAGSSSGGMDGGTLHITGGIVTAESSGGAAIGGGYGPYSSGGYNCNLTIEGGVVAAFIDYNVNIEEICGHGFGDAIGNGRGRNDARSSYPNPTIITGGTVIAKGSNYGDDKDGYGIYASEFTGSNFDKAMVFTSDIKSENGDPPTGNTLFVTSPVYEVDLSAPGWSDDYLIFMGGDIALKKDITIPDGSALIIPNGWGLNVTNINITNNGTIYCRSVSSYVTINGVGDIVYDENLYGSVITGGYCPSLSPPARAGIRCGDPGYGAGIRCWRASCPPHDVRPTAHSLFPEAWVQAKYNSYKFAKFADNQNIRVHSRNSRFFVYTPFKTPASILKERVLNVAASGSWDTMSTAVPPEAASRKSSIILRAVSTSRSLAGSSAMRMRGLFTNARAIATRRASPPESSLGAESFRWAISVFSRSSIARASRISPSAALNFDAAPIKPGRRTLSSTDKLEIKLCPCGIKPIVVFLKADIAASLSREMSRPSIRTTPALGSSSPAVMLSSVLFPLPDLPVILTKSPASSSRLTSLRAENFFAFPARIPEVSPLTYSLLTFFISSKLILALFFPFPERPVGLRLTNPKAGVGRGCDSDDKRNQYRKQKYKQHGGRLNPDVGQFQSAADIIAERKYDDGGKNTADYRANQRNKERLVKDKAYQFFFACAQEPQHGKFFFSFVNSPGKNRCKDD